MAENNGNGNGTKKAPLPVYQQQSANTYMDPLAGGAFNAQKYTDNPHGGPHQDPETGKWVPEYFVKGSDAYANHKQMVIQFQHQPSMEQVSFKAFITNFQETYNSDWAAETVYGRIDPIYLFKNTTRDISLAFKVPAESESEAFENLGKVQKLIQFLYPNYTKLVDPSTGVEDIFAQTISQSPMVRLKVMNLLTDITSRGSGGRYRDVVSGPTKGSLGGGRGILGAIQNVGINHGLEGDHGVFNEGPGVILPKLIEVSISFRPIHEGPIGWDEFNSLAPEFPYGVNLEEYVQGQVAAHAAIGASRDWTSYNAQEAEKKNQNLEPDPADAAQENTPLQDVAAGLTSAKQSAAAAATSAWHGLTGKGTAATVEGNGTTMTYFQKNK